MLNTNTVKKKKIWDTETETRSARADEGESEAKISDQRQMWVESAKCNNSHALQQQPQQQQPKRRRKEEEIPGKCNAARASAGKCLGEWGEKQRQKTKPLFWHLLLLLPEARRSWSSQPAGWRNVGRRAGNHSSFSTPNDITNCRCRCRSCFRCLELSGAPWTA